MKKELRQFLNCLFVSLFVLGLEHESYYCLTATAVFKFLTNQQVDRRLKFPFYCFFGRLLYANMLVGVSEVFGFRGSKIIAVFSNVSIFVIIFIKPKYFITLLVCTDSCCFIVGSFLQAILPILPKSIKNDLNTKLFCGCCQQLERFGSSYMPHLAVGNDLTDTKNELKEFKFVTTNTYVTKYLIVIHIL